METNSKNQEADINNFIQNPSYFKLFRGEDMGNKGGVYFSFDENWAKNFGGRIISGYLPKDARVKMLTVKDLEDAFNNGIVLEADAIKFFLKDGCDALITTDTMRDNIINIIVNPKHLSLFK